jgi:hypothetical protein
MRVRLGGYAILPRVLDKCRASLAGQLGEYKFNCPLDQHWFRFVGVDAEAFKQQVASGLGDGAMLDWIQANASIPRSPWEIQAWSDYHDRRGPDSDAETLGFFAETAGKLSKTREDIRSWAELLDLDDHVSFGGLA